MLFWPWSFSLSTFNFIRRVSTRKENKYYHQVRRSYLTYATHLCLLLCISHIIISTRNSSDEGKKTSTVTVRSKEKSIRLILLDLIMNHDHDHAAMLANTTVSANLGDHGMHSAASGHGLHSKDMMMMAVSDFIWERSERTATDEWHSNASLLSLNRWPSTVATRKTSCLINGPPKQLVVNRSIHPCSSSRKVSVRLWYLAFVASWFAVFFLAVLYEALKTLRDYLSRRNAGQSESQSQIRDRTL